MTAYKKTPMSRQIAQYIRDNPTAKAAEVAVAVGTTVNYVYAITHKMKSRAAKKSKNPTITKAIIDKRLQLAKIEGEKKLVRVFTGTSDKSITAHVDQITNLTPEQTERLVDNLTKARDRSEYFKNRIEMIEPKSDPVNHPDHYKIGGIETIDFIEAKQLSYNLGNVIKYITRSEHKGNYEQDLLKARWYLNREIAKLQEYK